MKISRPVLFTTLIIALLAVAGLSTWYLASSHAQQTVAPATEESAGGHMPFRYQLPAGWGEIACDSSDSRSVLTSPYNDKATGCDDRSNTVLILTTGLYNSRTTCLTDAQVAELKVNKPVSNYSCETVSINGAAALKESGDYGGGTTISYTFLAPHSVVVSYYANEDGTLSHAAAAEAIAQSLRF